MAKQCKGQVSDLSSQLRIRVTHNLKSASRALARLDSYPARDAIECPAMGAGCSDMPTLH